MVNNFIISIVPKQQQGQWVKCFFAASSGATPPGTEQSSSSTRRLAPSDLANSETFPLCSETRDTAVVSAPEQKPFLLGQFGNFLYVFPLWIGFPTFLGVPGNFWLNIPWTSSPPCTALAWQPLFRGIISWMPKQTQLFEFLSDCTIHSTSKSRQFDHKKPFLITSRKRWGPPHDHFYFLNIGWEDT